MVTLRLLDTTLFSPLGLAVLATGAVVTILIGTAFRRLGVIDDYRDDTPAERT